MVNNSTQNEHDIRTWKCRSWPGKGTLVTGLDRLIGPQRK